MSAPPASAPPRPVAARSLREFKYYDILVNAFVVILLVSNLVAQKIVAVNFTLFGFPVNARISAAQALFPITYIFGDIFTEVYGYAGSRRAIWIGFGASALLSAMSLFAVALPSAPEWHNQEAFETVFLTVPRVIVASLIAFWAGEFTNAFVMARMKVITSGRFLWMRTIGSTVAGQFVDTVLVMVILFWGSLSWELIANLIVTGYLGKVLYEAAATPLTYLAVGILKRKEGVDVYDTATDFNPFHGQH